MEKPQGQGDASPSPSPLRYLGQRGQQPLRVVQGGPAVRQTVGHVPQLLPDRRQSDLDVGESGPVQLAPGLQITEDRQGLPVQLLQGASTEGQDL